MNEDVLLAINLCDLSGLGTLGPLGSPLNLMLREDLGDELLPGAWQPANGVLDGGIVLVRTTPERAEALQGGLEVIGKAKIRRPVRCTVRQQMPDAHWTFVGGR